MPVTEASMRHCLLESCGRIAFTLVGIPTSAKVIERRIVVHPLPRVQSDRDSCLLVQKVPLWDAFDYLWVCVT